MVAVLLKERPKGENSLLRGVKSRLRSALKGMADIFCEVTCYIQL